ncbi:MAG: hypothetical protein IT548_04735 [Alphaproteobacteria bacterium]|nr:hypothetical protein [Alphaproteobacteria bacterium]
MADSVPSEKAREARTASSFALFAGLTAAALATAGIVVLILTSPLAGSAPSTFLFAFTYSWLAGLVVGWHPLSRMARRGTLNGLTAATAGAMAAAFPGLLFLLLIANCTSNGAVWGIAMCVDGVRTETAWLYSAGLLAGLGALGAVAGLAGFGIYRVFGLFLSDSA